MTQAKYVIKNGNLIEESKANISVYNKALFFDFAVYSNIKVIQGKMYLAETEIKKLFESAKIIGLRHPLFKTQIINWTRKLIDKNKLKDALVRVLLIGATKESEPILFLFPVGLTFYPYRFFTQGVKLVTYSGERFMPTSKTKDLLLCYIAYREAQKQGATDALLVDKKGNIREGTRSSFFAIKGNTLIAPPKEKVLEGVTRKIITSYIAPKILKVKEADIPLKKLKEYDEYFISGTTFNIMPVRQINNVVVQPRVGKKVKELQKLYKEYYHKKILS